MIERFFVIMYNMIEGFFVITYNMIEGFFVIMYNMISLVVCQNVQINQALRSPVKLFPFHPSMVLHSGKYHPIASNKKDGFYPVASDISYTYG